MRCLTVPSLGRSEKTRNPANVETYPVNTGYVSMDVGGVASPEYAMVGRVEWLGSRAGRAEWRESRHSFRISLGVIPQPKLRD